MGIKKKKQSNKYKLINANTKKKEIKILLYK
jgi:hypothetical protein